MRHDTLEYLASICNTYNVATWFEPISIEKCVRIVNDNNNCLIDVTYMSPNQLELYALLRALKYNDTIDGRFDIELLCKYGRFICSKGCKNLIITLGKNGVLIVCANGFTKHIAAIPMNENEVLSTNGAGDSLTGAIVAGLIQNESLVKCVKMGVKAAYLSIKSKHAVASDLTWNKISVSSKL